MIEQRAETRILCADLVELRWKDVSGATRRVVVNLEDISLAGACVQLERPIPLGVKVRVTHKNGNLVGAVRYCVFREIGYFVGIEFAPGQGWSPHEYRPQHMLDPRRLVRNTLNRLKRYGEGSTN